MSTVRIEVAWRQWYGRYRWMRMTGGVYDAHGDIDRERAQEIIANNPNGHMVEGEVSFAATAPDWHWQVEIETA